MVITFDSYFNLISFTLKGICLTYGISERIKTLSVSLFDPKNAYIEFNTNIGIEAIDILDDTLLNKKQYMKNKKYISTLKQEDLKMRCV